MIIECKSCHARFRLDESKIRGRGARVKCRKCGDQIVVLKEPPAAEAAPPPDNLIPFPVPAARAFEAPGKDEVDLAFEALLTGTVEPPKEEPSAEESPVREESPAQAELPMEAEPPVQEEPSTPGMPPFEPPADLSFEPPEELTFEPPADLSFEPPEELTFEPPPVDAFDPPREAEEEPPAEFPSEGGIDMPAFRQEEPVAPPPEEGFLIGDSETTAFLQRQERDAGIGQDSDISLSIAETPAAAEIPLLIESTSVAGSGGKDAPASPDAEVSIEGNATPEAESPAIEAPPYREEEQGTVSPASASEREPASMPAEVRPSFPIGRIAGILALAALLGAAGFLGLTDAGKRTIDGVYPRVAALFGGSGAGKAESLYEVKERIPYYASGAASPQILVIEGQVTNLSSSGKSGIRVHASLLDNAGKVLMEQAVYAGNAISGEKLQALDRPTLEKTMSNPLGERLTNMDVAPGKAVPFMVLFFDAPSRELIDSYRLEAKDTK